MTVLKGIEWGHFSCNLFEMERQTWEIKKGAIKFILMGNLSVERIRDLVGLQLGDLISMHYVGKRFLPC